MRVPEEVPSKPRSRHRGLVLLALLVLVVIVLVVVQGLAGFYTNFLWFHWTGLGAVWRTVIETKVLIATVFVVLAFVLLSTSFWLVDKIAPRAMFMAPDSDLVRRYQSVVGPHALVIRNLVAFVVALFLGAGTSSQWQHWLLFEHAVPFGTADPLFHRDVSFYVFRLPFLSFLVDWVLVALLVAFLLSAAGHFLNGAIRLQGSPRIEPRALAHLSLLLGLMALVRAWAYYYVDRFALDLSHNGYVDGAAYTDVHVRLPAITLLSVVSLVAFVLLIVNVYQRTWVLPVVAVGLWALLAFVVGDLFPALVQALRVTPSQSPLEAPYIGRNIAATQYAMGLADVGSPRSFPANEDLNAGALKRYTPSLDDVVLWDPSLTKATVDKLQDVHSYYSTSPLQVDRYTVHGKTVPVVVAARTVNAGALPTETWVNTHLAYTHGYGVVVAQANTKSSSSEPVFLAGNLPPSSASPSLHLQAPGIYYAPGQSQYVVVNTGQAEVNYQGTAGNETTSGKGTGGVPIGSLVARAAYAIHLRDFNLLVSNLIHPGSRILPITNVRTEVEKALPFLAVDSNPYAVVANGEVYWMLDAYTTTSYYPYGESASNGELPQGSGLGGSYDYVRDAVKVVVNAHSGKMSFYTVDASGDPLIESYERAFPGLFQPLSAMPTVLRAHLRYPQNLLMVQAAMYGRYHVSAKEPSVFYSQSAAWDLSGTSGYSSSSFYPEYELLQLPGESGLTLNAVEPLVPYSPPGSRPIETLKALLVADSSAGGYGKLEAFATPQSSAIEGPALASSAIDSNPTVSREVTLLGQQGSAVTLGEVQILPIADSLLYVRPLYVSSTQTALPLLAEVVVQYGQQIAMEPTLSGALDAIFGSSSGSSSGGTSPSGGGTSASAVSTRVRKLVAQASSEFAAAQRALAAGDLGSYQADVSRAGKDLAAAERLLAVSPAKASTSGTKASTTATPTSTSATPTTSSTSTTSTTLPAKHGAAKLGANPSVTTTTGAPDAARSPSAVTAGANA